LLYDLTYLESAGQEDSEFIKKLVSMFIEIMPVNLDELNEVVKTKDFKQIRKTAHKIKSSIDLLGIHSLTHIAYYPDNPMSLSGSCVFRISAGGTTNFFRVKGTCLYPRAL